jgi:hypothetical protein
MSNFRIKKSPGSKSNGTMKDSNTLEKKHLQKIKSFENKKCSLDKVVKTLKKVEKELALLKDKRNSNMLVDLEKRAELLNLQKKYSEEIEQIINNHEEINYYDLTGDLLTDYYDLRKDNNDNTLESKNIMEYLTPTLKNNTSNDSMGRAELFDRFCQRVDGVRVNKHDGTNRIRYCEYCDIEKTLDLEESSYICPECGDMEFVIIDEDKQIKDYSPYQRRNHFKEWLNQFQAKETTEISEKVFEDIITELNKNRVTSFDKLNRYKMQKILKKLGYNKLYEHIPFIINKLTGVPAPRIDLNTETKFIQMFMQIQEPWELYKPKGRKNFLSYPYILYKFSELLELDDLLTYFPMLQPTKLMEQDQIWQKFCKHLKWEFYPTT